jgi:hypothetical protein
MSLRIVIYDFDAIARGMRDEYPPGLGVERYPRTEAARAAVGQYASGVD